MRKLNHTLFFVEGNPSFPDCDAAMLGVAFDKTASYGKGSAKGPGAILNASHHLEAEQALTGKTLQIGIHNMGIIEPKTSQEMIAEIEKRAKRAIEAKKFFILLGGEHSIVNGLLGAIPKDVSFINFDAHLDLREEWTGGRLSFGCVAKRIFDAGFKQQWVGVRDQIGEEEIELVSEKGFADKIFYCPTQPRGFYEKHGFQGWMKEENCLCAGTANEKQIQAILNGSSERVWINIDIDCIDSRELHGTGTPMPFGLKLESLNELLFRIASEKEVVGFNLVELMPNEKDLNSETIAAIICYNIMSWKFNK